MIALSLEPLLADTRGPSTRPSEAPRGTSRIASSGSKWEEQVSFVYARDDSCPYAASSKELGDAQL